MTFNKKNDDTSRETRDNLYTNYSTTSEENADKTTSENSSGADFTGNYSESSWGNGSESDDWNNDFDSEFGGGSWDGGDWNGGSNFGSAVKKKHPIRNVILIILLCILLSAATTLGTLYLLGHLNLTDSSTKSSLTSTSGYDLQDATGSTKTVQEISSENTDSVVEITTESVQQGGWVGEYVTEGAGSGVVIKSDGYIMTNYHVVEGASTIKVTLDDDNSYDAEFVGADSENDVAVLKIDADDLTPVTYGNSDQIKAGDMAVVIGNPLGTLGDSISFGIISATDRTITLNNQEMNLIQTDATVNPGNSGGGMFNGEGQMVGLVVAKSSGEDVEGLGFAIPINVAAEAAQNIMDGKGDTTTTEDNQTQDNQNNNRQQVPGNGSSDDQDMQEFFNNFF